MRPVIRWLYLNLKYRLWSLPTEPAQLEKLAMDLNVPLAFTYRAYGLDMALAQQRINKCLKSFRWSAPLVLVGESVGLIIVAIIRRVTRDL
jgi:hypothetical protein